MENFVTKNAFWAVIFSIILLSFDLNGQVLEGYVSEGLKNNVVLQQQAISLEQALYSLKTAKSHYLPSTNLQGNYTTGEGGRSIELPLGSLMNPIYSTLNQLTNSTSFPSIENQEISFTPNNFYDIKLHTILPIVNSDIYYNKKIQQQNVKLKDFELNVYKRELVKNIKTSYYNYLSSLAAIQIYSKAIEILDENVRINEKLIENGNGLQSSLFRSQSEREKVSLQFSNAKSDSNNAKRYFNFLLNKELESEINTSFLFEDGVAAGLSDSLFLESDSLREEVLMLQTGEGIYNTVVKMNKSYLVPKINFFLDLGSQSEDWRYNNKSRYYMLGVQIDVPIFNGGRNCIKIKQSKLDYRNAQLNTIDTRNKLQLKTEMAKNDLASAWNSYKVSQLQLQSAQSYFKLINKGFKEGGNSLIEFLDARNQMTSAELMLSVSKYKIMVEMANVEREMASYILETDRH